MKGSVLFGVYFLVGIETRIVVNLALIKDQYFVKNWESLPDSIEYNGILYDKKMAKEYVMSFSMKHKEKQFELCTHLLKDNTFFSKHRLNWF